MIKCFGSHKSQYVQLRWHRNAYKLALPNAKTECQGVNQMY